MLKVVNKLKIAVKLQKSNIKCEFVATGPKEERSIFWQKATEEQMKQGIPVIQLPNRDGFFYARLWFPGGLFTGIFDGSSLLLLASIIIANLEHIVLL